MPSATTTATPVAIDLPQVQGRYADLDGCTVAFETFPEDLDPAPLFAGLSDDRRPCRQWGMVQSGRVTFRWVDLASAGAGR